MDRAPRVGTGRMARPADGEKRRGTTRPHDLEPRPRLRHSPGLPPRLLPRSVSRTMEARAADENRRPVARKPAGVRYMGATARSRTSSTSSGCLVPLRRRQEAYAAEELKGRKEDSVAK